MVYNFNVLPRYKTYFRKYKIVVINHHQAAEYIIVITDDLTINAYKDYILFITSIICNCKIIVQLLLCWNFDLSKPQKI